MSQSFLVLDICTYTYIIERDKNTGVLVSMEDYAISDDEHYGDDCGFDEYYDDDCGFSDGFEEPESESRRPNEEASSSQVM